MSLPTNYQDDIIDTSQNTKRVYDLKDATSGTVIQANVVLEDKTVYTQHGTSFGATDVNNITGAVNDLTIDISSMVVIETAPPSTGVEGRLYFSTV